MVNVTSRRASTALTWFGAVVLFLGVLAGLVNRNVLDGPRFTRHVDAMRQDPAVARQLGLVISAGVLSLNPELVSLRPLVEVASTSLAASSTLSGPFQSAVGRLHGAFTGAESGAVVFRLADVGAVVAAVLPTLSDGAAARVPADLDVTLASFGSGSAAATTIHWARIAAWLSWLLPLLAFLLLLAGIAIGPERWRATSRTGWAVVVAGLGVGAVALAGAIIASVVDRNTLDGALVAAAWNEFGGDIWWAAAIMIACGGVVVAVATNRVPQVDLAREVRRITNVVLHPPARTWTRITWGLALAGVGLGAVLRPSLIFGVLGALTGLVLLVVGLGEVAAAAGARRAPAESPEAPRKSQRFPWIPVSVIAVAIALVGALVGVDAAPASSQVEVDRTASSACNGHVQLCDRRYDDVAYAATHNSMAAADEPGWFIPEQPTGLVGQLQAGIRVLLIDTWYGQTTQRPGVIATAPDSHDAALAEANRLYGPALVESALRIRNAITPRPTGPIRPYLCHTLCEIGATEWGPVMGRVRAWLTAHPREVVSFVIQDQVTPADTAKIFKDAGLLPYVYTHEAGSPWPTLGQMIDSGKRVVVLMERRGGGTAYPWMLQGFNYIQDTPFSNPTVADLSCRLQRGKVTNPLLLLNYWLSDFSALVGSARVINAYDILWPYATDCQRERGQIPNYIAVNYYNYGDLFRVVDQLNGVRSPG
jgi:hypothetical protein